MITKRCSHCEIVKPVSEFGRHKNTRDGFSSWCSLCKATDTRLRNQAEPEKKREFCRKYRAANQVDLNRHLRERYYKDDSPFRNRNLKRLYGITLDGYNALLEVQSGLCACCGTNLPGAHFKNMLVDHSHPMGEIRGLLCYKCNSILGFAGDSVTHLLKLVAYLLRTQTSIEGMFVRPPSLPPEEVALLDDLAERRWDDSGLMNPHEVAA